MRHPSAVGVAIGALLVAAGCGGGGPPNRDASPTSDQANDQGAPVGDIRDAVDVADVSDDALADREGSADRAEKGDESDAMGGGTGGTGGTGGSAGGTGGGSGGAGGATDGPGGDADAGGADAVVCVPQCPAQNLQCFRDQTRTCSIAADGCARWTYTPCVAGLLCQRRGGPVCIDAQWANWPVPNSPSDVAEGAPNAASFTNNGDDTVTDNVTGLMWQRTVSVTTYTLLEARDRCVRFRAGGHEDWRVPTAIELLTIVDFGRTRPSVDLVVFPDTPPDTFLTATQDPAAGWIIDFVDGRLARDTTNPVATTARLVRCVR